MQKTLWSSEAMGTTDSRWRMKKSLGGWQSLEVLRPCALFSCGLQWALRSPGSSPMDHLMEGPPWGGSSFTLSGKQQLAARPSLACPLGAIELQKRELYRQEGHR